MRFICINYFKNYSSAGKATGLLMKCLFVKVKALAVLRENWQIQNRKDPCRLEYQLDTGAQFNFVHSRYQDVTFEGRIQLKVRLNQKIKLKYIMRVQFLRKKWGFFGF